MFVIPLESLNDFGFLFGKVLNSGEITFSAAAGISYIYGVRRGEYLSSSGGWLISTSNYKENFIQTFGIPVQTEIMLGASHNLNFSFNIFGNINPKNSFGGFLVCLRLGAVKAKK
ncbi:MAG: hypothetical protein NTZ33_10665 [Bacteroidetes bacterium]|nr:hypothetical protein [Bacteroidota bacterium]